MTDVPNNARVAGATHANTTHATHTTPAPTPAGGTAHATSPTSPTTPAGGTIGVLRGSALYIAAVLGTGVLVLPALSASIAGPASILAVVAVCVLSIPLAGTFAALAARYPDAGGVATFVSLALGKTAARMAGYWFFFGVLVGAPVATTLGAQYLVAVLGGEQWQVTLVTALIFAPPLIANLFGVRVSGSAQLIFTGLLVVMVVVVVLLAVPAVRPGRFEPFLPHGWASVGMAISLFVWAFAGWEAVTHIAGEFRNPRRTIPIATAIAVAVVGVAYLAIQVVTIGVLGGSDGSTVPLLDLVATTAPGIGPAFVAAIAAVVTMGVLNTYLLAFANLGASLGRDGHLPRWLAKGADAGQVPRRALAVVSIISLIYYVVLVWRDFDLTPFVLVNTSSMVAVYGLGMVAAVRLLERFSVGWWLAVVSLVLVCGLVVLAGASLIVPAALAIAAVVVTLVQARRPRSTGRLAATPPQ